MEEKKRKRYTRRKWRTTTRNRIINLVGRKYEEKEVKQQNKR